MSSDLAGRLWSGRPAGPVRASRAHELLVFKDRRGPAPLYRRFGPVQRPSCPSWIDVDGLPGSVDTIPCRFEGGCFKEPRPPVQARRVR